jgi:hypothetical protein
VVVVVVVVVGVTGGGGGGCCATVVVVVVVVVVRFLVVVAPGVLDVVDVGSLTGTSELVPGSETGVLLGVSLTRTGPGSSGAGG